MWEQALKIASQVKDPVSLVAVTLVLAAFLFWNVYRSKRPLKAWILGVLAAGIILLGFAPLAASVILQLEGIYHVRAIVLGPDHLPSDEAHLTSSVGGEPKKVEGGWEFDIPPQSTPADRTVVFYASVKNAFLIGKSMLLLARDYYPTTTIQLASDTSAILRGVVMDERHRSVADATVTIEGYVEKAESDDQGNFSLPAHAAEGQIVQVRAQKGPLIGNMSVPAGREPVEIILRRP
jgi:hypothetical protein